MRENDDTVSSPIKRRGGGRREVWGGALGPPRRLAVHFTHLRPYGMKREKSDMPIKCPVSSIDSG